MTKINTRIVKENKEKEGKGNKREEGRC